MAAEGAVTHLVDLFDSVLALASGMILGSLIMYYLLKDGSGSGKAVVARVETRRSATTSPASSPTRCRSLRSYGKGRSVMSGVVSVVIGAASLLMGLPIVFTIMVVNFVGGYIPYIGAFLGGGLAVIVALGDGGIAQAALMLLIVLAANLLLENFVEPKVMGSSLDIHPLVVLVVTALGGLVGGMVGLILAVPAYVIARDGLARLRSRGVVDRVTEAAQPAVQKLLELAGSMATPAREQHRSNVERPHAPQAEPARSGRRSPPSCVAWGVLFGLYYLVPFDDRTAGESLVRAVHRHRRLHRRAGLRSSIG